MSDRKRKWVYWSTTAGTFGVLAVFWAVCLGHSSSTPPLARLCVAALVVLSLVSTAKGAAASMCRPIGLSLHGSSTETISRGSPTQASGAADRVVVRMPRGVFATAGALQVAGALLFISLPRHLLWQTWAANAMAGASALSSLLFWVLCFTNARVLAVVDGMGITQRSWPRRKVRQIPWERIAECEIRTRRNVLGQIDDTLCVLRGSAGETLVRLPLGAITQEEREQFLEAIRARQDGFARSELIAAEAPAGLGTELQAAEEPAGRGTEPEAAAVTPPGEEPAESVHAPGREGARGG